MVKQIAKFTRAIMKGEIFMIKNLGKMFVFAMVGGVAYYIGYDIAERIDDKIYIWKQIKENHKRNKSKVVKFRRG